MSHTPGWSKRFATLVAATAIIVSACSGAASTTPTGGAPQQTASGASQAPYTGEAYPATAVDCANKPADYTGTMSQIKALDRLTVEFDLCAPDVAFLSKVAFTSNFSKTIGLNVGISYYDLISSAPNFGAWQAEDYCAIVGVKYVGAGGCWVFEPT